jgi:hypothetical protein
MVLGGMCRGAYDQAYVTALGPSIGCTAACKEYKGADSCGGDYAISLYRLTGVQYDTGAGEQRRQQRGSVGFGPSAKLSMQLLCHRQVPNIGLVASAKKAINTAYAAMLQSA